MDSNQDTTKDVHPWHIGHQRKRHNMECKRELVQTKSDNGIEKYEGHILNTIKKRRL